MKTLKKVTGLLLMMSLCMGLFGVGAFAATTEVRNAVDDGEWHLVLESEDRQDIATYSGKSVGEWTGNFALYHNDTLAVTCTVVLQCEYSAQDGTSTFTSKEITKSAGHNGYAHAVLFSNTVTGNKALLRIVGIKDSKIYEGQGNFEISSDGTLSLTLNGIIYE